MNTNVRHCHRPNQVARMKLSTLLILFFAAAPVAFTAQHQAYGPLYSASAIAAGDPGPGSTSPIRRWNQIAINASGLDHTPVAPGETRTFGEQLGPCRAARAIAIVHVAMFDSINAIFGGYKSFTNIRPPGGPVAVRAAVSQAAHDTLVALFPSQAAAFDTALTEDLDLVPDGAAKTAGIDLGRRAAAAILALKANDGSRHAEPRVGIDHMTSNLPGRWRQDPISQIPLALGAYWGACVPFVLQSPSQFRCPVPPALNSPEYTAAYNEVKRLGGDGTNTPTERTADQTFVGIYWAYDGTPSLCAPPKLYNQIATTVFDTVGNSGPGNPTDLTLARLLALLNVSMADAGIASWESKYYYDYWRPITGIREADPGTGPSGAGDGNPDTAGDTSYSPLGAPASNLNGPNFTPPFPAYPSGHATFGGALFQTLRRFYGTDEIEFTFVSDEYNGTTRANDGTVRPLIPRTFSNLSDPEEENGQSRIYLGIHWSFDKTAGIAMGRQVGNYVYDNAFTPSQNIRIHNIRFVAPSVLALTVELLDPNADHRVDQRTSLTSGTWSDASATFGQPLGNMVDVTVPVSAGSANFYRVVETN
jgi:hypothetical protein